MEDQGGQHLGQRHAGPAPASLGQGGLAGPKAFLKSGWKTCGNERGSRVQKDWAYIQSNALPENFCIAVRGHKGWSKDPDNTASYTLAVTFDIVGQEIAIYDPLRIAVQELQTELGIGELEAEAEIDLEE